MLRVVPWSSREEWLTTYHNLYNFDNIRQQVEGLKCAEVWKSRSGSKLPLAVEVTMGIVAAMVEDNKSMVSHHVIRHIMAMAIVRFVNSMVDMEQKGAYARSVQSIADDIGLPDWLVDIRHEATHASLPSLQILRTGCRFGLEWLQEHYWESQITEFQERDQTLATFLRDYAGLFGDGTSEKVKGKKLKKKNIVHQIAELVGKYNMWQSLLAAAFGEERLLFPPTEMLERKSNCKTATKEQQQPLKLPKEIGQHLNPFLKSLQMANNRFLSELILFLLNRLNTLEKNSKSSEECYLYSCLVMFILSNCHDKNRNQTIWKLNVELDYKDILAACLENPSRYTKDFLPLIVERLKIPKSTRDKLLKLSTFQITSVVNGKFINEAKEDLELLKKHYPEITSQKKTTNDGNSLWQICSSDFARQYKFGEFVGMPLSQYSNFDKASDKCIGTVEDPNLEDETSEEDEMEVENCSIELISEYQNHDSFQDQKLSPEMINDISKNIWTF